jgi:hypothetical protein
MANPFYLKAKKEIMSGGLTFEVDGKDVTDKIDMSKSVYPAKSGLDLIHPNAKIRVKLMGPDPAIVAYVTQIVQEFSEAFYTIDWISVDGKWRGTAKVAFKDLAGWKSGSPFTVTADSAIKTYDSDLEALPSYFAQTSGTDLVPHYSFKPAVNFDLSQIEADLAKLPSAASYEMASSTASGAMTPTEFAAKYGPLIETFANAETQSKLAAEQIAKYGDLYLEKIGDDLTLIDGDKVKVQWNASGLIESMTPIGKVTDLKETPLGLEFSAELLAHPKGYGKSSKLQEANALAAMHKATMKFLEELWIGLPGLPPQLQKGEMMGINQILALPDGSKLEAHITIQKKEEKP